jgi:hypothetical protein
VTASHARAPGPGPVTAPGSWVPVYPGLCWQVGLTRPRAARGTDGPGAGLRVFRRGPVADMASAAQRDGFGCQWRGRPVGSCGRMLACQRASRDNQDRDPAEDPKWKPAAAATGLRSPYSVNFNLKLPSKRSSSPISAGARPLSEGSKFTNLLAVGAGRLRVGVTAHCQCTLSAPSPGLRLAAVPLRGGLRPSPFPFAAHRSSPGEDRHVTWRLPVRRVPTATGSAVPVRGDE